MFMRAQLHGSDTMEAKGAFAVMYPVRRVESRMSRRNCPDGPPASVAEARTLEDLFAAMQAIETSTVDVAWAECFKRYSERVWSCVFYVIRTIPWLKEPGEVTADVVSEVFARLPAAVQHYRDEGRAEQWLMRVATRAALRQKEAITGKWSKTAPGRVLVSLED